MKHPRTRTYGIVFLTGFLCASTVQAQAHGPVADDDCSHASTDFVSRCLAHVVIPARGEAVRVTVNGEDLGNAPMVLSLFPRQRPTIALTRNGSTTGYERLALRRGSVTVLQPSGTREREPAETQWSWARFLDFDECSGYYEAGPKTEAFSASALKRLREGLLSERERTRLPTVETLLAHEDLACVRGNAVACRVLGEDRAALGDSDEAVRNALALPSWLRGCSLGDGEACVWLSRLQRYGLGTGSNPAAGRVSLARACTLGLGAVCYDAAVLFDGAEGLPADSSKAAALYALACTAHDARGCDQQGRHGTDAVPAGTSGNASWSPWKPTR